MFFSNAFRKVSNNIYLKIKQYLGLFRKIPRVAISRNALFIHIPKAAGSTISTGLYGIQISHTKARDYYLADRENYNKIQVFTIVRNPIERFCSAYYFLKEGGMLNDDKEKFSKYMKQYPSINEFALSLSKEFINSSPLIHFVPQYRFLYYNERCIVDYIYKLEELDSDILLKQLGIGLSLNRVNQTKRKSTQDLSAKAIAHLEHIYEEDIYLFGYNFK